MLMYSKDDNVVTREQLADYTPGILDLHTRSHKPRPFADVVDMAQDELERAGFYIGEQLHVLARKDTQLFSMLEIRNFSDESSKLAYAIRSSVNKTLREEHAIAETLSVCTNLEISASECVGTKNTTYIGSRIRVMVREYVSQVTRIAEERQERGDRYRSAVLKDHVANHTIIRMLQAGVINTQRVEKVVNEYYEPSHAEHLNENGDRTAWTLQNACTEAFKGSPIATYTERCDGMHQLLGKASDYALAA